MARILPISKVNNIFTGRKKWIWLGLVLVLAIALLAVYWFLFREVWVRQPAILRILNGDVEISTSSRGEFVKASDETWFDEKTRIRTKEDSQVILQFFEGSAVSIEGPAEVSLLTSRALQGQRLNQSRSIALELLRGKIKVTAARLATQHSLFEIQTPNSVGIVQGTTFQVEIAETGTAYWQVSQGILRVGAICVGQNQENVVLLTPLTAERIIAIPSLPVEWQPPATQQQLIQTTRNIVLKSLTASRSDISVGGTTLLASNPEMDIALFHIAKITEKSAAPVNTPEVPASYTNIEHSLFQMVKGLVVARPPVTEYLFVPHFAPPEIWVTEPSPVVRRTPPNYQFSIYDVTSPLDVAFDPIDQLIAITEGGGQHTTRLFDDKGNEIMALVPPGTTPLNRAPSYVTIDSRTGTVYVSDRMRHTIDIYDIYGPHLGTVKELFELEEPWSPLGLTLDDNDNLYITDVGGATHRVLMINTLGEIGLVIGQELQDDQALAFPNDLTVHGNGRIYVSDGNNFRVQVFNTQGERVAIYAGVGFPRGMAIEGDYLYVVDIFGHTVHVYDLSQEFREVFHFGQLGVGDGQFNFPNGLDMGDSGTVLVTDRENDRVQVWQYGAGPVSRSQGSSWQALAGLWVGIAAAAILIAVTIYWLVKRRRAGLPLFRQ